jgi:hypothetical protein
LRFLVHSEAWSKGKADADVRKQVSRSVSQ